jgi:hypothetical protein
MYFESNIDKKAKESFVFFRFICLLRFFLVVLFVNNIAYLILDFAYRKVLEFINHITL